VPQVVGSQFPAQIADPNDLLPLVAQPPVLGDVCQRSGKVNWPEITTSKSRARVRPRLRRDNLGGHMRRTAVVRGMLAASVLGLALVAASPAFAARGLAPMSKATVTQVVRDTGLTEPARCYDGQQARSDKRWGVFWGRYTANGSCQVGEGYWVVHKTRSGWHEIGLGGSSVPCSHLMKGLRKAGAPLSVYRDLKSERYCN